MFQKKDQKGAYVHKIYSLLLVLALFQYPQSSFASLITIEEMNAIQNKQALEEIQQKLPSVKLDIIALEKQILVAAQNQQNTQKAIEIEREIISLYSSYRAILKITSMMLNQDQSRPELTTVEFLNSQIILLNQSIATIKESTTELGELTLPEDMKSPEQIAMINQLEQQVDSLFGRLLDKNKLSSGFPVEIQEISLKILRLQAKHRVSGQEIGVLSKRIQDIAISLSILNQIPKIKAQ